MESKNKTGFIVGLISILLIVAFGFVWVYFGAAGKIPDIGFGLKVNPIALMGGLIVAAVVLYLIMPKGPKK